MFFDLYLLRSQGKFGVIWIAGTRGVKALRSADIQNLDIVKACNDILQMVLSESAIPRNRLSLSLSTRLLHGVIRIYHGKVIILYEDVCKAMTTVKKPLWFLQPLRPEKPRKKRTKKPRGQIVFEEEVVPQLQEETPAVPQLLEITDADISRILVARDPNIVTEAANITMVEIPDKRTLLEEENLEFGTEGNLQFIEDIMGIMPKDRRVTTETIIQTRQTEAVPISQPVLIEPVEKISRPVIETMDFEQIETVAPAVQETSVSVAPVVQETPVPVVTAAEEPVMPEIPPEKRRRFVLPKIQNKDGDIVKTQRKELKWKGDEDFDLIEEDDPKIDFRAFELDFIENCCPLMEFEDHFLYRFMSDETRQQDRESLESVKRSLQKRSSSLPETPVTIPLITVSETHTDAIIPVPGYVKSPIAPLRTSSLLKDAARSPVPIEGEVTVPEQHRTPSTRDRPSGIAIVPQRIPMDIEEEIIPQAPPVQEAIHERMQTDEQIIPQVQITIQERSLTEEEIKINRQQQLKEMIRLIKTLNKRSEGPITIEDVAKKPLSKKTIAVAFSCLLELHKKEYVELKAKDSSSELDHIVLGKKLTT